MKGKLHHMVVNSRLRAKLEMVKNYQFQVIRNSSCLKTIIKLKIIKFSPFSSAGDLLDVITKNDQN